MIAAWRPLGSSTCQTIASHSRDPVPRCRDRACTTHATDDQTKSSLAFITAAGGLEAGKEVAVALLGEGAYLAKEEIANSVHGVGFPPLTQLIQKVVSGNVPVYV
jgi:predicted peroxiredoxin